MDPIIKTLERAEARLREAGLEDQARFEAWMLLAKATGHTRAELLTGRLKLLSDDQQALLDLLVRRRAAREPLAYILGEKEFWSLSLQVTPAVLIPRPDSETLIEAALDQVEDRRSRLRLLDLGTGSGCLLLALLSELPNATGLGIDASDPAVSVARANAIALGLAERAEFSIGDWGRGLESTFDLIVCNPPYVRQGDWPCLQSEIRDFEPRRALVAGPDGLEAYRALAPDLARLLKPGGAACLEVGQGQGDAVAAMFEDHGLTAGQRRQDLAGIERCVIARHAS